jgi:hypothetical protein
MGNALLTVMTHLNAATKQMIRLNERIKALGGTIPAPWPWAVVKQRKNKVWVDAALRNLQLLELVEDLEKKATKQ